MKAGLFLTVSLIFFSSLLSAQLAISQSVPVGTLATGQSYFTVIVVPLPPTISCSGCSTGICTCSVSQCTNGTLYFYHNSDCSDVPYKQFDFISGNMITFDMSNTVFTKIVCYNGAVSNCIGISNSLFVTTTTTTTTTTITTATTTTTTTTTTSLATTPALSVCPYDCCSSEPSYFDKDCAYGEICTNNVCLSVSTTTTSSSPQYKISFSLIASSFISILLLLFLLYFVFGRVIGKAAARTVVSKTKKERTIPSK